MCVIAPVSEQHLAFGQAVQLQVRRQLGQFIGGEVRQDVVLTVGHVLISLMTVVVMSTCSP